MENNNNQVQNTAAQAAQQEVNNALLEQEAAQAKDNNVPQSGNNEGIGKDDMPLTTERFHSLLVLNTVELSKLRVDYAKRLAAVQRVYDDDMDRLLALEHQANDELHDARKAYEDAKQKYEQDLRNLKTSRNEAEHRRNEDKAHAKNFWALANEKIQSERHNLFERYRNSGGVLTGAEEGLLHPGWTRIKEGGVSNEEQ
jgi:hypothetical protein